MKQDRDTLYNDREVRVDVHESGEDHVISIRGNYQMLIPKGFLEKIALANEYRESEDILRELDTSAIISLSLHQGVAIGQLIFACCKAYIEEKKRYQEFNEQEERAIDERYVRMSL